MNYPALFIGPSTGDPVALTIVNNREDLLAAVSEEVFGTNEDIALYAEMASDIEQITEMLEDDGEYRTEDDGSLHLFPVHPGTAVVS